MSANFLDKNFGRFGNRCFQSFYIYAQMRKGLIPDIYLQDYRYFDEYKTELQQMFGQGEKEDRIAVHFRRGKNPSNPDEPSYSENSFYVNLADETDYYQKAMSLFPNEKFLLFSDNSEWLGKNWQGDYEFAIGNEQEDFRRFADCKGHIIANSSWSFMAAYLGGGKTVTPNQWFIDKIKRVNIPEDWQCV